MFFFIIGCITYISFCCCVWQFYVIGTDPNLQMRIPTNDMISELIWLFSQSSPATATFCHVSQVYLLFLWLQSYYLEIPSMKKKKKAECFACLDWFILQLSCSPSDMNNIIWAWQHTALKCQQRRWQLSPRETGTHLRSWPCCSMQCTTQWQMQWNCRYKIFREDKCMATERKDRASALQTHII